MTEPCEQPGCDKPSAAWHPLGAPVCADHLSGDLEDQNDIVFRLRRRAEIRRQIPTRKSAQEGERDRLADLLDEAADEIEALRPKPRRYDGKVKWFDATEGYGMIAAEPDGAQVFISKEQGEKAKLTASDEGLQVTFEIEATESGKATAKNIYYRRATDPVLSDESLIHGVRVHADRNEREGWYNRAIYAHEIADRYERLLKEKK